jgi:predicted O-methyltransferase YrrM
MRDTARTVQAYISHRSSPEARTVADLFGTENFCHFLYSLVRMDRPSVVVELGCGGAATALMVAQALLENGHGQLWTIDNGSDWTNELVRETCLNALGAADGKMAYAEFISTLLDRFGLSGRMSLVEMTLNGADFFDPGQKIDMLFSDATPSHAEGCLALLKYYLPRVNTYSSIFIDRAGTINHAWLLLRYVVDRLQTGKIPLHLTDGCTAMEQRALEQLVKTCEFQLINLTETMHLKKNKMQNSRAWIKIQPHDYIPHNDVLTFGSVTSPWELK